MSSTSGEILRRVNRLKNIGGFLMTDAILTTNVRCLSTALTAISWLPPSSSAKSLSGICAQPFTRAMYTWSTSRFGLIKSMRFRIRMCYMFTIKPFEASPSSLTRLATSNRLKISYV
jgi:hypothetical protein